MNRLAGSNPAPSASHPSAGIHTRCVPSGSERPRKFSGVKAAAFTPENFLGVFGANALTTNIQPIKERNNANATVSVIAAPSGRPNSIRKKSLHWAHSTSSRA